MYAMLLWIGIKWNNAHNSQLHGISAPFSRNEEDSI